MAAYRGCNGSGARGRGPVLFWLAGLAVLVSLWTVTAARAVEVSQAAIDNRRCLQCHGQSRMAEMRIDERNGLVAPPLPGHAPATRPAVRPGIYVPESALSHSTHKDLSCVSCHASAAKLPHALELGPVSCNTTCHTTANGDYLQSIHAYAHAKGDHTAPTCATCHGGHDVLPKADRNSRTFPLNIVKVCGDCHAKHVSADGSPDGADKVNNYLDSVHGKAVSKGGLAVAATCADCHSNHKILPAKNRASTVNRENVPDTCGKCHIGVTTTYGGSVHGTQLAKGDAKAPVCTDCHTAHSISRTDTPAFMLDIVNECGTCHDRPGPDSKHKASLYETYRRSYHGQVTRLGYARAARCSDCHGAHDVRRIDDPASRLNGANRITTCKACHPAANANFAMFAPHADHRDGDNYPVLHYIWLYFVVMMSFAFGFFGLHCVFWFLRSVYERVRHGRPHHNHNPGPSIQRFNRVDRVNHAFVILSFFGLTLTGLPLLYSDKAWAQTLMGMFGGVRQAGMFHRFFAIILILNFVVHGFGVANRIRKYGLKNLLLGPTTMLPRWKDLQDLLGMYKWFIRGGRKPKFDRWTYWEKFDYIAEVGGSGIIGLTGLLLWFPEFFSRFLPGWVYNAATIIHGYEALLAIGFIFSIHFFNAHLRLEKFPVDDVMFTGRLPEEEFKEERGAEYERLLASGELEKLRTTPPAWWYRYFAVFMGITAMAIGTAIVVLIVLAGLKVI